MGYVKSFIKNKIYISYYICHLSHINQYGNIHIFQKLLNATKDGVVDQIETLSMCVFKWDTYPQN